MTRLVFLVAAILDSLAGGAQARPMDGEAVGRFSLQVVGFLVSAWLFYLALSGVTMPLFSGRWRNKGTAFPEHRELSELAGEAPAD
jgi:hypothetical protein